MAMSTGMAGSERADWKHVVVKQEHQFAPCCRNTPLECNELPTVGSAKVSKPSFVVAQLGEDVERLEVIKPVDHDDKLKGS
jgi:hypothetical protein